MRKTARAIVVKDGNILLMDRNKFGIKYKSLIGGALEMDEDPIQALFREVKEECQIEISNPRLVIIEDAGAIYGLQYIYLCDYVSGEPRLDPNSEEYNINQGGKNIYQPIWYPLNKLKDANLLPNELSDMIIDFFNKGFPSQVVNLKINS